MAEKILIVDDDLETLRLVGLMLQRQGYEIAAANNGAQALQQAVVEKPDLILLDVMMPDMDGFEVTRRLRGEPDTANIPILMFTAKSQVEDKVIGYEAGVDDYLTKPTHPAELTAHVKALLTRATKGRAPAQPADRGHMVAFISAKGGTGISTLVLNVGISLHQKTKRDVILAEMRPGYGSWGPELGYVNPVGLKNLVQSKPGEITPEAIEKELVTNASGVRLLMSSYQLREIESTPLTAQYHAILSALSRMAPVVLVDLGANVFPGYDKLLETCDEAVIVVEPNPTTVTRTKTLLEELNTHGFGRSKLITLALVNRVRADIMLSWSQVQESLGLPVAVVVTPAPELAYQAALRFTPMILLQQDGLAAQQFGKLAELIGQRIRK